MQACGRYRTLGVAIRTKCIECHMPLEDSALITSKEGGRTLHALLRTHQITIYRDATERVESSLKSK